jgi:hypothetical protein
MILTFLFWLCAALLVLKVMWNVCVPYVGVVSRERGSISLFVELDIVLLALNIALSMLLQGTVWPHSTPLLAAYASTAVLVSYSHLVAASALFRWLRRRRRSNIVDHEHRT